MDNQTQPNLPNTKAAVCFSIKHVIHSFEIFLFLHAEYAWLCYDMLINFRAFEVAAVTNQNLTKIGHELE